jgi:hypothetical protein
MTDYYVSSAGSDSNTGSYSSPWKTTANVNSQMGLGAIGLKDRVLFRRGDTFYGLLRGPGAYSGGSTWGTALDATKPGWLRIGAYGSGANPVISGYKILNTSAGWTLHATGVWKLIYSAANVGTTYTGSGATDVYTEDVGFLKVDGVIKAVRKVALADLSSQWDFYSDTSTKTLYVKSSANPTTLATDIRCSIDIDGLYLTAGMEVADLTFEGFGGNGVYAPRATVGGGRGRVLRCTIREIGGALLDGTALRYGNGITVWGNATDLLLENNIIHDVYDAAFSIQGSGTTPFTNILWRRNLTYRCSQAEEYSYFSGTGPGFVNCRSEYNTHLFCGYGFGADTRSDTDARDGLQTYQWGDVGSGYTGDVNIRRNVWYDCRSSFSLHARVPLGLKSDYNVILLRPGKLLQQGLTYTIDTLSAWKTYSGRETHSQFLTLPASSDVDISDADVTTALADLSSRVRVGQVMAIQAPWT